MAATTAIQYIKEAGATSIPGGSGDLAAAAREGALPAYEAAHLHIQISSPKTSLL